MRNNEKGRFNVSILLIIVAGLNAIIRFSKGEIVDGILWASVAILTLIKEIRIYRAK